jgi:hypothetical protein
VSNPWQLPEEEVEGFADERARRTSARRSCHETEEALRVKRRAQSTGFGEFFELEGSRPRRRRRPAEPKPLPEGAMERGAFCESCGQLGPDEEPLLGGYNGDDVRLRCPRGDCDSHVSYLKRGMLPSLPGGFPPLDLCLSAGPGSPTDWPEVSEWWKRGHEPAIVLARGTKAAGGSGEPKKGRDGKERELPEILRLDTGAPPAPISSLVPKKEPLGCRCCEGRKATSYASLLVVSGGMTLGRILAAACADCLELLDGKIDPEELSRLPRKPWRG